MSIVPALVLLSTFCVSLAGSGLVRHYALRAKLLDLPNSRSLHTIPTPRGGGLSIALSFLGGIAVLWFLGFLDPKATLALLAGGAIAGIGFLDDKRQLSARLRFGVHLVAAGVVVAILGGLPVRIPSAWGTGEALIGGFLAVFAFTWATNLFNFMDGIDGFAGSEAIFISAAGALLNHLAGGDAGLTIAMLCLSAATLGFLRWNWPPARLFMGDVGSGFLGFTIAVFALATSRQGRLPIEVWPILGSVFLVDATVTLIRRMVRGDIWFEAHRMHAYQHLALNWNGHLPVTLLLNAINVVWLFPLAFYAASHQSYAMMSVVVAQVPLVLLALWTGAGKQP